MSLMAVRQMKVEKGENWKKQVTRVPLDCPVDKQIVNFDYIKGDDGEGDALFIDLKVIQEETHVDALEAKLAVSPEKSIY